MSVYVAESIMRRLREIKVTKDVRIARIERTSKVVHDLLGIQVTDAEGLEDMQYIVESLNQTDADPIENLAWVLVTRAKIDACADVELDNNDPKHKLYLACSSSGFDPANMGIEY